jgi:transposase InsO family protein
MDIKESCGVAKVSRSGYYHWLRTAHQPDKDYPDYLVINELFKRGKSKYGFRTIKMKLASDKQIVMNHKKIIRIMKKYWLFTKIRRINPYRQIMKKTQEHRIFDNQLNREFKQFIPYSVLCTDITYLPFNQRFAYLSVVKDIASNEVLGWKLSKHLEMNIVLETIDNISNKEINLTGALIHSDQGFHYTNPEYIKKVKNLEMVQSMSRKGNCIDNAPMESFFGHLKDDVDYKDCRSFEELNLVIDDYMEYYNNKRYQWNLKKMTPVDYRNHLLKARL